MTEWLSGVHYADQTMVKNAMDSCISGKSPHLNIEYRYISRNGDIVWISNRAKTQYNDRNEAVRVVGINNDISKEKKRFEEASLLSYHDALTNLPNRVYLKDRIEQAILRIARGKNDGFTLLYLDLDGFKHVNDTYGHVIGDLLLIIAAERFIECVRSIDTVARVGGDEFIILLDGITNHKDISKIASRISQKINNEFIIEQYSIFISVSIGVETDIKKDRIPDDIIQNADRAMYMAKIAGKNRIHYFDDKSFEKEQYRWTLGNDLHKAIAEKELEIHYQPIFELSTGNLFSFEALLRWQHPGKGLISPVEFIPIAEETGLITSITQWVIQNVCEKIISLSEEYPTHDGIIFAVNIASKDFMTKQGISGTKSEILTRTGCTPARLAIQVTEGAIIRSYEHAVVQLRELKEIGVHLELDDFGTGYSSLSYISSFPLNIIKIDKTFISGMFTNEKSRKLTESIISLAHNINLEVIAEGVESSDQLSELYSWGCDYAQGFLYSPAIHSGKIENYLNNLPRSSNAR